MEEKIQAIIDEKINPYVKLHNGSCELVNFINGTVTVRLTGGCIGCPSSKITLYNGVRPILIDEVPEVKDVELEL